MKIPFLTSVAVTAFLSAGESLAQPTDMQSESADSSQVVPPKSTETPPTADDAREIVVTAQKRTQRIQDVPIAVSAFTEETLQSQSINAVQELQRLTPGLAFNASTISAFNPLVTIRGQGTSRDDLGKQPSVGVYQDGIYAVNSSTIGVGDLVDIARIEVLKGPQGTLFGRNTPGGAINIITNAPSDEYEAVLRGMIGSYDDIHASAVLNVPFGDKAAMRLVGNIARGGGYLTEVRTGRSAGEENLLSGRVQFRVDPVSDLQILARAEYSSSKGQGLPYKLVALRPFSASVVVAAVELLGYRPPFTVAQLLEAEAALRAEQPTGKYDIIAGEPFPRSRQQVYALSVDATYSLTSWLKLRSISAYRNVDYWNRNDPDAMSIRALWSNPENAPGTERKWDQLTQELQLNLNVGKLDLVSGLYYFNLEGTDATNLEVLPAINPASPPLNFAKIKDQAYAGYAHANYALTDDFTLTAGARITHEKNRGEFRNTIFGTRVCNVPVDLLPASGECVGRLSVTDNNVSWTLGADYEFGDRKMVYAKVSTGFKAGGFNTQGTSASGSLDPFHPELATTFEAGLKADWLRRTLRTNVALHYTDLKDIQRATIVRSGANNAPANRVNNAAAGQIWGLELETWVWPMDRLTIQGNVAYLRSKYDEYTTIDQVTGATLDISDNPFPNAPKWQANAAVEYVVPASFGDVTLSANYFYQSKVDFQPDNHTIFSGPVGAKQGAYGLLNGRIAANLASGFTAALFAKNITNKFYYLTGFDVTSSLGYAVNVIGPPRTFGLELIKRF